MFEFDSVGSNVRESLNGESKADFIHKMLIAQKEAYEKLKNIYS